MVNAVSDNNQENKADERKNKVEKSVLNVIADNMIKKPKIERNPDANEKDKWI
ncbi:hypothetical protein [Sporolactobacillus nakayamae]|uniref:hypothetical protein n=1 Tax=Sporolactobacillus nakayamae TaxID=269670 RepID=UPI0015A650A4|nr:hypothetical protein [Sporolactobacillus nakayamae]